MSSEFKFFYNDWVTVDRLFDDRIGPSGEVILNVNLTADFFENLKFDKKSLETYKVNAATRCAQTLGDSIALAFSGGVDSQVALLAFKEAGIPITVYSLVFDDNLNMHDVRHARKFCKSIGVKLEEIKINIWNFLNRENYDLGIKYKSISPQFNVHYKLFDMLREMGHTGVVAGGQFPAKNEYGEWGINFTRNPYNFINYTNVSNFNCQGSFLSFDPELSWALALNAKDLGKAEVNLTLVDYEAANFFENLRYLSKINAYVRSGFNVIPQKRKQTGFELIKLKLEVKNKDTMSFDKYFRMPLIQALQCPDIKKVRFNFLNSVDKTVNLIHDENSSDKLLTELHGKINNYYNTNLEFDYVRSWL